jgi:hypothetical protein
MTNDKKFRLVPSETITPSDLYFEYSKWWDDHNSKFDKPTMQSTMTQFGLTISSLSPNGAPKKVGCRKNSRVFNWAVLYEDLFVK